MTNTKFRKRALLSSVAMLLVALVALGSATFAWFAANPNAEANGLSLKTTASTGLVIKTDTDSTWSHDAFLGADTITEASGSTPRSATFINFNLTPASQKQNVSDAGFASTFYKVDAAAAGSYEAADGTNNTPANAAVINAASVGSKTSAGDVYAEKVYFRFSDGTASSEAGYAYLKGVKITASNTSDASMAGAIRVAVADSDGKILGTYALSTASDHQTLGGEITTGTTTYDASLLTNYSPTLDKSLTSGSTKTFAANAGIQVSAVAAAESATNYCTVYVYLDGQDSNCYSDKVGSVNAEQIIQSIQLDFSLNQ